jgi:hypothetical protein
MKHVSELAIISLRFIIEKQHLASRAYKFDHQISSSFFSFHPPTPVATLTFGIQIPEGSLQRGLVQTRIAKFATNSLETWFPNH